MRNALVFLTVTLLAIGLSAGGVAAEAEAPESTSAECATTVAGPPCGWINPQLYLDIPDNIQCGKNNVLGADVDFTECMAPPKEGEPVVMNGEFRLTWEVSEEGTYLNDPNDPVVVNFRPTGSNPEFIDFSVDPPTFELGTDTLFNPTYFVTKENGGTTSVWYEYIQPVTVTFTRNGDPTPDDIETIQNKDGQVRVLVRIHSDSSGSTYKDSYGLESFVFHIRAAEDDPALDAITLPSEEDSGGWWFFGGGGDAPDAETHDDHDDEAKDTPVPSVVLVAGALGAAAFVARRRV